VILLAALYGQAAQAESGAAAAKRFTFVMLGQGCSLRGAAAKFGLSSAGSGL